MVRQEFVKDEVYIDTIVIVYDQMYISGGAAKIAINSAVQLKKMGYRVIFFGAVGTPCDQLTENKIETICLNEEHIGNTKKFGALLKGIWNSNSYNKLRSLLKTLDRKKTIVHVHGWTKALSSSIFLAAYKEGFSTIITGHEYFTICQNGGLYNYKKNSICDKKPGSIRCYLCNCDKKNYFYKIYRNVRQLVQTHILNITKPHFLFITVFSRRLIEQYMFRSSGKHYLNNFVEVSKRERVSVERNMNYLYIGRISDEKGIDLFCEAMKTTGSNGVVIGEGPLREINEKKYHNVKFVGWKNADQMQEYLLSARALIISSKWYETMGLTAVEMQQYGIPCIIPRECAASEFIQDESTGLLYTIGDLCDLTKCIDKYKDGQVIKQFSLNYYNSMDWDRFSIEKHCASLIDIYKRCLWF